MIRCYYTQETLNTVSKAGRNRAIGCGGFWYGWMLLALVGMTVKDPQGMLARLFIFREALFLLGAITFWCGMGYFFHRLLCNVEKTTLQHAGDEIILDDNELRLSTVDGTQITLPRKGLRVYSPYYASGRQVFKISNSRFVASPEIVLTSDMENAKELIEMIQPGAWDTGE